MLALNMSMKNQKLLKIAEDFSIELIFLFGSQKERGRDTKLNGLGKTAYLAMGIIEHLSGRIYRIT